MSDAFVVPDSIPDLPIPTDSLRVPDTVSGSNIKLPEWDYTNFGPFAIFHTKIGIASFASIASFGILSTLNPPFVQESHGENSCLLYTSPSPRDQRGSRMPSSA